MRALVVAGDLMRQAKSNDTELHCYEFGTGLERLARVRSRVSSGLIGINSSQPTLHDNEDIEEFPLLLQSDDVRALIEAARQQGVTAPGLARRLIGDYLRQMRSDLVQRNRSAGRSHP